MIECRKFLGKFRGLVVNNKDPQERGRIQVQVPDVSGLGLSTWALPSLPIGGIQTGVFSIPVIGSGVWVEFEQGDLDYPIWVGTFWGTAAEVPVLSLTLPAGVPGIVMQTPLQNGILLSDATGPAGGILLKNATGAFILINDTGIFIDNGKGASITMNGPTVIINKGNLMVLG
jgi:uncharacterized protein involved in type VI secretion and phage assembly